MQINCDLGLPFSFSFASILIRTPFPLPFWCAQSAVPVQREEARQAVTDSCICQVEHMQREKMTCTPSKSAVLHQVCYHCQVLRSAPSRGVAVICIFFFFSVRRYRNIATELRVHIFTRSILLVNDDLLSPAYTFHSLSAMLHILYLPCVGQEKKSAADRVRSNNLAHGAFLCAYNLFLVWVFFGPIISHHLAMSFYGDVIRVD